VAASNNRVHPTRSLSSSPLACTINCSPGSQALLEATHQDHSIRTTLLLLVRATYIWCCSSRTFRSWCAAHSAQRQRRGCNNIPYFLQRTAQIARSFCEGFTQHDLHILVTAPFCCDRKSPSGMCTKLRTVAASNNRVHPTRSQSSSPLVRTINCSPGSQALLEIPHQDHSVRTTMLLLVRTTYIWCCSSRTFRSWCAAHSAQTSGEVATIA